MTESFKVAPYGVTAWVWTIVYILFVLYFVVRTVIALANGLLPDTLDAFMAVVLTPLLVYTWIRSVRGYRLEGDDLVIDRAGPGKIHIAIKDIEQVKSNPDLGSFFNVSFLSLGGVFGWAGRVRVRKPSDVRSVDADAYGTNPTRSLLLELKSGSKVILTPSDPQAMETSLRVAGAGAGPKLGSGTAVGTPRVARSGKRR